MKDVLKRNDGFSLVELIIVIYFVVVAVLFILAFMKKIQMLIPCLVLIVPVALVLTVFIIGAIKEYLNQK